jgi:Glycogen recognition site of AMP-activated protein kinase
MGTFVFKWEHAASEVYVTGTFDNWSMSEKLIQTGNVFEKNVTLPSAAEKIYYKVRKDKSNAPVAQKVETFAPNISMCGAPWSALRPSGSRPSKYLLAGVRHMEECERTFSGDRMLDPLHHIRI